MILIHCLMYGGTSTDRSALYFHWNVAPASVQLEVYMNNQPLHMRLANLRHRHPHGNSHGHDRRPKLGSRCCCSPPSQWNQSSVDKGNCIFTSFASHESAPNGYIFMYRWTDSSMPKGGWARILQSRPYVSVLPRVSAEVAGCWGCSTRSE